MRMHRAEVPLSKTEWIEPYAAATRLANQWDIPPTIAEQIVWEILRSGQVLVRGVPTLSLQSSLIVPRFISKEIGATLRVGSLFSLGFRDVEMDWNGLVAHGRNLVPSWVQIREYATSKEAAVAELLDGGAQPGKTMPWITFYDTVRDRADGWASERDKRPKRGFGDRSIERLARRQMGRASRRHRQGR
jgi:hypothetical protein